MVTTLVSPALVAQQAKAVKVPQCEAADSLLGPGRSKNTGTIRARYYPDSNSTTILTAGMTGKWRTMASGTVEGTEWAWTPPVSVTVFLNYDEIQALVGLGRSPKVGLVLDDSVTVEVGVVSLGRFIGPANVPRRLITVPVSAILMPEPFLALARSRSAVLRVEQIDAAIPSGELRNLRALFVALTCKRLH